MFPYRRPGGVEFRNHIAPQVVHRVVPEARKKSALPEARKKSALPEARKKSALPEARKKSAVPFAVPELVMTRVINGSKPLLVLSSRPKTSSRALDCRFTRARAGRADYPQHSRSPQNSRSLNALGLHVQVQHYPNKRFPLKRLYLGGKVT